MAVDWRYCRRRYFGNHVVEESAGRGVGRGCKPGARWGASRWGASRCTWYTGTLINARWGDSRCSWLGASRHTW